MGKKERKPLARALPALRSMLDALRGEERGPETRYRYRFDRRSLRISAAVSLAVVLSLVALYVVWGVQYLPAWILFFVVSVIALYILSIPRYLSLDDDSLDVHCLVDLTRIHVEDIESIRRMDRSEFRRLWPLLGSYGFWGYYGYYFNFGEWTLHRVYASDRKKLILIEDIYEDTYIVSCDDPDRLIAEAVAARDRKRAEILRCAADKSVS